MPRTETVRFSYDRHAALYDRHAALEKEVCDRLLDRVTFRREEPAVVLDLGCGSGTGTAALKKTFKKAQVVGLDLSRRMLEQAGRRSRLTRPLRLLKGNMAELPFRRHSADLVFSNLALPWLDDASPFFDEVLRVLKPGGMLLFSTYGAGSLAELYEARNRAGEQPGPPAFPDVLQLGDTLTAAGFREPVMDIDRIRLDYPGLEALVEEFEVTGSALLVEGWREVRENIDSLATAWVGTEKAGRFALGLEVLYGIAFGPPEGQPRRTENGDVATFSVDSLLKSRKLGYS